MRFVSDDQRKAMFARLGGSRGGPGPGGGGSGGSGGSGNYPRDAFGAVIGGIVGTLIPKRPKGTSSPTAPTSHNNLPATRPKHMGGGFLEQINILNNIGSFNSDIGIASIDDWKQSLQGVHLAQFNLLYTLFGWNPSSWTEFLFQNTLFDDFSFAPTTNGSMMPFSAGDGVPINWSGNWANNPGGNPTVNEQGPADPISRDVDYIITQIGNILGQ